MHLKRGFILLGIFLIIIILILYNRQIFSAGYFFGQLAFNIVRFLDHNNRFVYIR